MKYKKGAYMGKSEAGNAVKCQHAGNAGRQGQIA